MTYVRSPISIDEKVCHCKISNPCSEPGKGRNSTLRTKPQACKRSSLVHMSSLTKSIPIISYRSSTVWEIAKKNEHCAHNTQQKHQLTNVFVNVLVHTEFADRFTKFITIVIVSHHSSTVDSKER